MTHLVVVRLDCNGVPSDSNTYEAHRSYLARRREVRDTSIRVRHFGKNLLPIVHSQDKSLVIHAIGTLFNSNAGFRSH